MALPKEITTNKFGFHTKWELTRDVITNNRTFATKMNVIEGMPDVKWSLKWIHDIVEADANLYLNLESQHEIEYTTYLHYYLHPDDAKSKNGTSNEKNTVLFLDSVPFDDVFERYMTNGILTINFHGVFHYTQQEVVEKEAISSSIFNASDWGLKFKQNGSHDFSILVEGQIIPIHKSVISAESTVFTKMFEDDFKEAKENKVAIIDFKYDVVQAAIDYCYAQNISPFLQNQDKAFDLLHFVDKYDFTTLKPKLEKHFSKKVCKENVHLFVSISDKTNALQLRHTCINFIRNLFNKNDGFSAEEISTFDKQFLVDVIFRAMNN